MAIQMLEGLSEEQRPAVEAFITNHGLSEADLAPFKTFDEFMSGYKPKTAAPADWATALPEDQRALLGVKGWKTPSDAIKGYAELEKYIGHDKIPMPRKDKDGRYIPEDLHRVMTQLGLPKDANGYVLPKDFKPVEGSELTEENLASFKAEAHKLNMLPYQYEGAVSFLNNLLAQGKQAEAQEKQAAYDASMQALRNKWGLQTDARFKMANMVLKGFVDKEDAAGIVEKYGNDPAIIKLLANIGDNLSEEVLQRSGMRGSLLTPDAAEIEIKKIMHDFNGPYYKQDHPEHKYWVDRVAELNRMVGEKKG